MFTSYFVAWFQFEKCYLRARRFAPNSKLTSSVLPEASCFASLFFEFMVPKVQTENFHELLCSAGFSFGLNCSGSDSTNTTIRSAQDAVPYPKHKP